jgi:hypothetical protein
MRAAILAGDTERAMAVIADGFPGLLEQRPVAAFELQCLHFVELVKKGDPLVALEYARRELPRYTHPPGGGDDGKTPQAAQTSERPVAAGCGRICPFPCGSRLGPRKDQ